MRLPRWITVLLIVASVLLPVLAVALWVVGPEFTTRRFVQSLRADDFERASKMMANATFLKDERGHVCLESANRTYCFSAEGWKQALSESNTQYYTNSIWDWVSGKREFGLRHQDFYVTFKFEAGPQSVWFQELHQYFEQKAAYKEFSIYGFSHHIASTDPLCVEGDYTFGDPDGGFFVLFVDGEEQDRCATHIAYGRFKLTSKVRIVGKAHYRLEVVDQEGNLRNKAEWTIESQER
jgi:hypothetical protein